MLVYFFFHHETCPIHNETCINLLSAQMCTTECRHLTSIHGADMDHCITTHQLWEYSIGLDISRIGPDYSECTTALWSYNK